MRKSAVMKKVPLPLCRVARSLTMVNKVGAVWLFQAFPSMRNLRTRARDSSRPAIVGTKSIYQSLARQGVHHKNHFTLHNWNNSSKKGPSLNQCRRASIA